MQKREEIFRVQQQQGNIAWSPNVCAIYSEVELEVKWMGWWEAGLEHSKFIFIHSIWTTERGGGLRTTMDDELRLRKKSHHRWCSRYGQIWNEDFSCMSRCSFLCLKHSFFTRMSRCCFSFFSCCFHFYLQHPHRSARRRRSSSDTQNDLSISTKTKNFNMHSREATGKERKHNNYILFFFYFWFWIHEGKIKRLLIIGYCFLLKSLSSPPSGSAAFRAAVAKIEFLKSICDIRSPPLFIIIFLIHYPWARDMLCMLRSSEWMEELDVRCEGRKKGGWWWWRTEAAEWNWCTHVFKA